MNTKTMVGSVGEINCSTGDNPKQKMCEKNSPELIIKVVILLIKEMEGDNTSLREDIIV